jgi:hypothetical protein
VLHVQSGGGRRDTKRTCGVFRVPHGRDVGNPENGVGSFKSGCVPPFAAHPRDHICPAKRRYMVVAAGWTGPLAVKSRRAGGWDALGFGILAM